jgi:O-antigen/teichoic acid export membrane protein
VFSDLGMANYIVYKQKSTPELNSTIFWMCLASGFILFLGLSISSSFIAGVFDRAQLEELLPLAALAFLPISAMSQLQAQFTRTMRLVALAKIEITARILATISAILVAFYGYGVESIIYGNLVFSMSKCFFIWIFAETEWRPSIKFSLKEAKSAWQYGVYQIGSQLINQLRVNLDTLFLAFYLGDTSLGYYSLAKQLISKPTALILPVARKLALPLIAQAQTELTKLNSLVSKAHAIVVLLLMWPYSLFVALSSEITTIVYGDNYQDVALLIVPLSIYWLIRSVGGAIAGTLVQALGKTKIDFYWNVVVFCILATICSIFAQFGGLILAWTLLALQCVLLVVIYFIYFRNVIDLHYSFYFVPILKFGAAALVSSFSSLSLINMLAINNQLLFITSVVILSGFLNYLLCWLSKDTMISLPSPLSLLNKLQNRVLG